MATIERMPRYVKLERTKVINKIYKDFVKALRKFTARPCPPEIRDNEWPTINYQETYLYVHEQNPKSTKREFFKGIHKGVPEAQAKADYIRTVNEINKSPYWKDEHLISVEQKIFKDNGKVGIVDYVELAKGEEARIRAKTFDKHIDGFKMKQEDLYDKADDKDLARRLNIKKKMREAIVG